MKTRIQLGLFLSAFSALVLADIPPQHAQLGGSSLSDLRYFVGGDISHSWLSAQQKDNTPTETSWNATSNSLALQAGLLWGGHLRAQLSYRYERAPIEHTSDWPLQSNQLVIRPTSTLHADSLQTESALASFDYLLAFSPRLKPFFGLIAGYESSQYKGDYTSRHFRANNANPESIYSYKKAITSRERGLVYGAELGAAMELIPHLTLDVSYQYLKHTLTHNLNLYKPESDANNVPTGKLVHYAVKIEPQDTSLVSMRLNYWF